MGSPDTGGAGWGAGGMGLVGQQWSLGRVRCTPPAAVIDPMGAHHTTAACAQHITSYQCTPIPTARTHHITPVNAHHTSLCPFQQLLPIMSHHIYVSLTPACTHHITPFQRMLIPTALTHHIAPVCPSHQCAPIAPGCARPNSMAPSHLPSVCPSHQCVPIMSHQ